MCLLRWDYFDEVLKKAVFSSGSSNSLRPSSARVSGNAGMIFVRCKTADGMAPLCKQIDDKYRNSDFPTRTQTEEAFGKMFEEMLGDMRGMIRVISLAVVVSLLVRGGEFDGDVDARANERGGGAQGDRLQLAGSSSSWS